MRGRVHPILRTQQAPQKFGILAYGSFTHSAVNNGATRWQTSRKNRKRRLQYRAWLAVDPGCGLNPCKGSLQRRLRLVWDLPLDDADAGYKSHNWIEAVAQRAADDRVVCDSRPDVGFNRTISVPSHAINEIRCDTTPQEHALRGYALLET